MPETPYPALGEGSAGAYLRYPMTLECLIVWVGEILSAITQFVPTPNAFKDFVTLS